MTTVALFGAGGKMGVLLTRNMMESEFDMLYVEPGAAGIERLKELGLSPTPAAEALKKADAVILAVPDALMEKIAGEVVPGMRSGAILITLDAAVPLAGRLPARADVAYLVTHPSHKSHYFPKKEQSLVNALIQGTDEQYALGERIARQMHAPVGDSYRMTLEQLAFLEPAVAETLGIAVRVAVKEAIDEAVRFGVPEDAAWDFISGHLGGIICGVLRRRNTGWLSEGALLIGDWGYRRILREDWKQIFTSEGLREQAEVIAAGTYEGRKALAGTTIRTD
ncbi:MAG: NAD(P)-binding domain-containing protein [Kiritimatiellae bacterium]|nr:NAD(P)-binding domain-containing protein [Kiritimatiellia bacterium]